MISKNIVHFCNRNKLHYRSEIITKITEDEEKKYIFSLFMLDSFILKMHG